MNDVEGWKIPGRISSVVGKVLGTNSTVQKVLRGELLIALKSSSYHKDGQKGHPPPNYRLKKDHNVVLYCKAEDVTPLVDRRDVKFLEGVQSLESRHAMFVRGTKLEWAYCLNMDTKVASTDSWSKCVSSIVWHWCYLLHWESYWAIRMAVWSGDYSMFSVASWINFHNH